MNDDIVMLIPHYLNIKPLTVYTAIMGKRMDRQAILAKRLYINMLKYKGHDYNYIAKQINCSITTIYKNVFNHQLKELIKEYEKSRINSKGRNDRIQSDKNQ